MNKSYKSKTTSWLRRALLTVALGTALTLCITGRLTYLLDKHSLLVSQGVSRQGEGRGAWFFYIDPYFALTTTGKYSVGTPYTGSVGYSSIP